MLSLVLNLQVYTIYVAATPISPAIPHPVYVARWVTKLSLRKLSKKLANSAYPVQTAPKEQSY